MEEEREREREIMASPPTIYYIDASRFFSSALYQLKPSIHSTGGLKEGRKMMMMTCAFRLFLLFFPF